MSWGYGPTHSVWYRLPPQSTVNGRLVDDAKPFLVYRLQKCFASSRPGYELYLEYPSISTAGCCIVFRCQADPVGGILSLDFCMFSGYNVVGYMPYKPRCCAFAWSRRRFRPVCVMYASSAIQNIMLRYLDAVAGYVTCDDTTFAASPCFQSHQLWLDVYCIQLNASLVCFGISMVHPVWTALGSTA